MKTFDESAVKRQAAGTSQGGQFATQQHPEVDDLGLDLDQHLDYFQRRAEMLQAAGYVPASSNRSHLRASDPSDQQTWWTEHFLSGEFGSSNGEMPKMPDDFTPSRQSGSALPGLRRTTRVKYEGGGVEVRMPSATAIRRFAEASELRAFDVPVTVTRPDGVSLAGWVRVAGSGHSWNAQALGFNDHPSDGPAVSEAVASILEARRPTMGLKEAGNLLQKHRARLAKMDQEGGIGTVPVRSSWVDSLGYDDESGTMVWTTQGRRYGYEVSRQVFDIVSRGQSVGQMVNMLKRSGVPRRDVQQCPACQRFYVNEPHTCPPRYERVGRDEYSRDVRRRLTGRRDS